MQKSNLKEERVFFNLGEYSVVLEKESFYDSMFSKGRDKFIFRYLKRVEYDNKKVQQLLLTRIYERGLAEQNIINEFEQEYTYGFRCFIPRNNSIDKYIYFDGNNISYGINEIIKKEHNSNVINLSFKRDRNLNFYLFLV